MGVLLRWSFFAFWVAAVCECFETGSDKSVSGTLYSLPHVEGLTGFSFGTPRLAVDMPVTVYDSATMSSVAGIKLLQRRVVVVKLETLFAGPNPANTEFFVFSARVGGIVYVLPDTDAGLNNKTKDLIETLKSDLMSRVWPVPIFLTRSTEATAWMHTIEMRTGVHGDNKGLLSSIVMNGILRDVINLKVSSVNQVVQQPPPPGKNISGWLKRTVSSEETSLPILAIVTHYDDFNLSSAFANSATSGSGLIAILEIMNRLSSVFKDNEQLAHYDVLFLATGGSALGYRGLQQWLADTDESVVNRIEFALCLDALVAATPSGPSAFTLHSSRPLDGESSNDLVKSLTEKLTTGSGESSLSFKTKKVRVYEQLSMPWQHEHFAALRILTASLSTHHEATPYIKRASILDSSTKMTQQQSLKSIIDILSTSIVAHVFKSAPVALATEAKANDDTMKVMQKNVEEFASTPRFFEGMPPSVLEKYTTSLESKFNEALQKGSVIRSPFTYTAGAAERRILRDYTDSDAQMALRVHLDALKELKVYYSDTEQATGTVQFALKTSKGFLFDLAALSLSAAFLGMTYAFLKCTFDSKLAFKLLPEALLDACLSSSTHHE